LKALTGRPSYLKILKMDLKILANR